MAAERLAQVLLLLLLESRICSELIFNCLGSFLVVLAPPLPTLYPCPPHAPATERGPWRPAQSIWGYAPDSGLKPCATYLRHCMLAAEKLGAACRDSFLDDTFLIDRTSTVREHLAANPAVLTTLPPAGLEERYGG